MAEEYLVDAAEKERAAIRRLPYPLITLGPMFDAMGVNPGFAWYLLEVDMVKLCSDMNGDIDILAGSLGWNDVNKFWDRVKEQERSCPDAHPIRHQEWAAYELAEAGEVKWPPDTSYLIAVEAKCSYLARTSDISKGIDAEHIKATKSSSRKVRKVRLEVNKLRDLGFNRCVLLDWIFNPPQTGLDIQAWLRASSVGFGSGEAMQPILRNRLPANSIVGHWLDSVGAVVGGDETMRGTGRARELREARENAVVAGTAIDIRRQEVDGRLADILGGFERPRSAGLFGLRVFFIDCRSCGNIHRLGQACS